MQELLAAVQVAQSVSPLFAVILTVLLLVDRAIERGWIRFGEKNSEEPADVHTLIKQILESQGQLRAHYNDETTEELRTLNSGIKDLAALLSEGFKDIRNKFSEYDRYGIKSRCPEQK